MQKDPPTSLVNNIMSITLTHQFMMIHCILFLFFWKQMKACWLHPIGFCSLSISAWSLFELHPHDVTEFTLYNHVLGWYLHPFLVARLGGTWICPASTNGILYFKVSMDETSKRYWIPYVILQKLFPMWQIYFGWRGSLWVADGQELHVTKLTFSL